MKILRRFEFRAGLWPTVATLLLLPLLLALGFWQLDRADQKAEMQADFQARYQQPTVQLDQASRRDQAENWFWRKVRLRGEYLDHSYLLDNQVRDGQTGYRVYTLLRLTESGDVVLVERDWKPVGSDRGQAPAIKVPEDEIAIEGRIVPPPATGIMLARHRIETMAPGVFRLQRIQPDELAGHSGTALLPYIVRQNQARWGEDDLSQATGGFGRERHLGYAFQWFALAATLVIIYIAVNIRKRD